MKHLSFIVAVLLLPSCRKERYEKPIYSYTPTSNTPSIKDPPMDLGSKYGTRGFLSSTIVMGSDSNTIIHAFNKAYFSPVAFLSPDTSQCMPVLQVQANGINFKFINNYYVDTTNTLLTQPTTWNVVGTGLIPSFTAFPNEPFPKFNTFYSLPDTLHRNYAVLIPLDRLIGCEAIFLEITDGITYSNIRFDAPFNRQIFLTIAMLQQLRKTNHAELRVVASHRYYWYQYFSFTTVYRKRIVIVD